LFAPDMPVAIMSPLQKREDNTGPNWALREL
jgi:hypothetical protein